MGWFSKSEKREGTFVQSDPRSFLEIIGLGGSASVSMEDALGVPAVWAAVNFISGTIAGLPMNVYIKDSKGNKKKARATDPTQIMLHNAVNDDLSSFQWRFDMFSTGVLTDGRFVSYIERDETGRPVNIFPLPGASVKRLGNGRKQYSHKAGGKTSVYDQSEVIDVPFMLQSDLLSHRSPLRQCAVAIGKAVNANEYGAKLFKNGGLPAFALQGPFGSEKSAARAADQIAEATREAARKGGNVLAIPVGHRLDPLGGDPEKMQMVETMRFMIAEVGRIFSLPPVFLQDLSEGIRSDVEQQDLHLVKHTLMRWLKQLEGEMNLKLFGRGSNRFVEFNIDGLLRGDFKTRMEGNARAIQTGQLTPNEARAMDNREPLAGGDVLLVQGATIPLEGAGQDQKQQTQTEGASDEP